jgi:uncharacterized membrane protein YhdT
MNNQLLHPQKIERHLKLWIYLLPIVGILPSIWTLYQPQTNHQANLAEDWEQKKVSRLSLNLVLIWLVSYCLLSFGATNVSERISFRLLYANAILTTAYFVTCIVLMSRLSHRTSPSVNQVKKLNKVR